MEYHETQVIGWGRSVLWRGASLLSKRIERMFLRGETGERSGIFSWGTERNAKSAGKLYCAGTFTETGAAFAVLLLG